jgi:hypothetical protein
MSDTPIEFSKEWFDDASKEWRANKRKLKGGAYRYTCEHTYTHGKKCGRDVYMKTQFCRQHWAKSCNSSGIDSQQIVSK